MGNIEYLPCSNNHDYLWSDWKESKDIFGHGDAQNSRPLQAEKGLYASPLLKRVIFSYANDTGDYLCPIWMLQTQVDSRRGFLARQHIHTCHDPLSAINGVCSISGAFKGEFLYARLIKSNVAHTGNVIRSASSSLC